MLDIKRFMLGPVQTNAYLAADVATHQAVAIDPAWDGKRLAQEAGSRGWTLTGIWITHAHFDHFGGAAGLAATTDPALSIALHPDDLPLWNSGGGAGFFGLRIDEPPAPVILLSNGMTLSVGEIAFEVRHCPGHSPGHVLFVCGAEKAAFVGDVIFKNGIGRSDLPGGDERELLDNIQRQVLSLQDEVRLFSGHGAATTVGAERRMNPFLKGGSLP